jgi:predicted AAA+ superfamily ATPase
LGQKFPRFVEINFERKPEARRLFQGDLSSKTLLASLSAYLNAEINPGETLLFWDEVQECPEAIKALRYFHEETPGLHVVGAGSLLGFELEKTGVPVGRVQFLHLCPVSFREFLAALGENAFLDAVEAQPLHRPIHAAVHEKGLALLKLYLFLGGLPEVVSTYADRSNLDHCRALQNDLVHAYRQDMRKYAPRLRVPHVEDVLSAVPRQWGEKFKFTKVRDDARAYQLNEALNLLVSAEMARKVCHSSGNGVPLGAEADRKKFKTILFDVGIGQTLLGLPASSWVLDPAAEVLRRGGLMEQFVGQEMISYADPSSPPELYYWHREARAANAEVDYLFAHEDRVIPVEVRSSAGGAMKSLPIFLAEKPQHTVGVKTSMANFSKSGNILSLPLYALWRLPEACKNA